MDVIPELGKHDWKLIYFFLANRRFIHNNICVWSKCSDFNFTFLAPIQLSILRITDDSSEFCLLFCWAMGPWKGRVLPYNNNSPGDLIYWLSFFCELNYRCDSIDLICVLCNIFQGRGDSWKLGRTVERNGKSSLWVQKRPFFSLWTIWSLRGLLIIQWLHIRQGSRS